MMTEEKDGAFVRLRRIEILPGVFFNFSALTIMPNVAYTRHGYEATGRKNNTSGKNDISKIL